MYLMSSIIPAKVVKGFPVPIRVKLVNQSKKKVNKITATLKYHISAIAKGTRSNDDKTVMRKNLSSALCPIRPGEEIDKFISFELPRLKGMCTVKNDRATMQFVLTISVWVGLKRTSNEHDIWISDYCPSFMKESKLQTPLFPLKFGFAAANRMEYFGYIDEKLIKEYEEAEMDKNVL